MAPFGLLQHCCPQRLSSEGVRGQRLTRPLSCAEPRPGQWGQEGVLTQVAEAGASCAVPSSRMFDKLKLYVFSFCPLSHVDGGELCRQVKVSKS